jgi:energy-coupling factor transport system ATP-binding protein
VKGEVRRHGRVALLFQNVEPQLLCGTAEEEVALGLSWEAPTGEAVARRQRVSESLAALGLEGFGSRTTESLSAGEKQRLVLAALVARRPAVLLLDEPTSALDAEARHRLVRGLAALKARGHAIVVADHWLAPFAPILDRCWTLEKGRLLRAAGVPTVAFPAPAALAAPGREVARAEGVCVRAPDGRRLLRDVDLRLRAGERVLLTGPNGSGKSTLLRALAGLVPLERGRVEAPRPSNGAPPVALLFQDPQRNLFETTVAREVAFTLQRGVLGREAVEARVAELLALFGLSALADRSPLRLSFGEQHRVALASVLAADSRLLLLDEPFAGLDLEARSSLLDHVGREATRRGAALVIASHDREPFDRLVHRVVALEGGRTSDG